MFGQKSVSFISLEKQKFMWKLNVQKWFDWRRCWHTIIVIYSRYRYRANISHITDRVAREVCSKNSLFQRKLVHRIRHIHWSGLHVCVYVCVFEINVRDISALLSHERFERNERGIHLKSERFKSGFPTHNAIELI